DTPGWDQYFGHGRINAMLALTFLTSSVEPLVSLPIQIYPNPSTGNVFLQVPTGEQVRVSIVDNCGRVVCENQLIQGTTLLAENLAAGLYFVLIQTEAGTQVQKLLVSK
ncbi:MAG: T9SS type A sorting domain-containing protein, partial [Bacteroidia bacterium]